jgi:hypothetical protein
MSELIKGTEMARKEDGENEENAEPETSEEKDMNPGLRKRDP